MAEDIVVAAFTGEFVYSSLSKEALFLVFELLGVDATIVAMIAD